MNPPIGWGPSGKGNRDEATRDSHAGATAANPAKFLTPNPGASYLQSCLLAAVESAAKPPRAHRENAIELMVRFRVRNLQPSPPVPAGRASPSHAGLPRPALPTLPPDPPNDPPLGWGRGRRLRATLAPRRGEHRRRPPLTLSPNPSPYEPCKPLGQDSDGLVSLDSTPETFITTTPLTCFALRLGHLSPLGVTLLGESLDHLGRSA